MGQYDSRDKDLHEAPQGNNSAELTETRLFGFSVPEARIHALLDTWVHPNLGVMSSGAFVAQGMRHHHGAADIPMCRVGQPEEIASAISWICSDRPSCVTGAAIRADGGMSL